MIDGTSASQIESGTGNPQITSRSKQERRSGRRLEIDAKIQSAVDWQTSLQEKVDKGQITDMERKQLIARSMMARELLWERANDRSRKDRMTGLFNHYEYKKAAEKLIKNGSPFGLLIIDLDKFKGVNDAHGHQAGDSVLIQTAQNLISSLRQMRPYDETNDQIYRYGGEEFAVLLPEVYQEENLKIIAEKIRTVIESFPYFVKKGDESVHIPITVSIGGGINRQEPSKDFFLRVDSEGLLRAKDLGRNTSIIVPAK